MDADRKSEILPPLAFGEASATTVSDRRNAEAQFALAAPTLQYFGPARKDHVFQCKLATANINGLVLQANSAVPITIELGATEEVHLLIPFFGCTTSGAGERRYEWRANEHALLVTENVRRNAISRTRSALFAKLDRDRLVDTASAMLGEERSRHVSLRIDDTRLLDLHYGSISFTFAFRQICQQIDLLLPSRALLEKFGLDDMFYRHAVCLLNPSSFFGDGQDEKIIQPASGTPVDAVCEIVRNRRYMPLTLTEMEKISGLSRRSLQYAFRKRFGLSPMEWQKQERLHIARERLLRGADDLTVTQLSFELGFSTPSSFTEHYRRLFAETPTSTMLRSGSIPARHFRKSGNGNSPGDIA